jgi:hypothetical protein
MSKTSLFAALVLVGAAGAAEAGGSPGTIGVGAEFQIAGPGGASLNYDAGDFHVGGFLGFEDYDGDDNTVFAIGGRFFYHLHTTTDADFGVGGSLGIVSVPEGMGSNDRDSLIYVEPGIQIRLFLTANVAFSASTGIVLGVGDADGVAITGSALGGNRVAVTAGGVAIGGGVGLHYYFF